MSTTWAQGGQPPGPVNSGPFQGPPPICFKCGGEHYVVACPQQAQSNPAASPAPGFGINQQIGYGPSGGNSGQRPQWNSDQNGSGLNRFQPPKVPPIVTQYTPPGPPPQFGTAPSSYGPPAAAPYQQYPGSAPVGQSFPPQQPSYLPHPQQYASPAAPPVYGQSYSAPPTAPPYGQAAFQGPPQSDYPQSAGAQQYGATGYQNRPQQFAPPPAAPYQVPAVAYPPPYRGSSGPPGQHPPKWNNATPISSYGASPYQPLNQAPFIPGNKRDFSRTSRQPSVSQTPQAHQTPLHTPQMERGSFSHQATPQTPTSTTNAFQPPPALANYSSPADQAQLAIAHPEIKSAPSSRASTPYARRASTTSISKVQIQSNTPTIKDPENLDTQRDDAAQYEDGELTTADLEEQEFNWEYKKIFIEMPPTENVRLAQPLSTTWESTPVPLLDARLKTSVSRYARKDNLKDFMKPIRNQPQWSYLQEDPAFSDSKLEGPLIPLDEVPAWIAERQGTSDFNPSQPTSSIRKRARSEDEEDVQDDVDNQIKLEVASEHAQGHMPNKRQKNENIETEATAEDEDTIIVQTSHSPSPAVGPGTPTIGRALTPSFGGEDDVWAPEPGEGASAPVDPTEALLASLGVSGSPKPVRKRSIPGESILGGDDKIVSYSGIPQSISPPADQPFSVPPQPDSSYGCAPNGMPQHFHPPSSNSPQGLPQSRFPNTNGQYSSGIPPHNNGPYPNPPYNVARQNSYGNVMPPQSASYTNQPYDVSRQSFFSNGISPQGNPSHASQQYGISTQNSYGNDMSTQIGPHYSNQLQGMPQQPYPPQTQYGHPVPPQVAPYNAPLQTNPAYNNGYGMPPQQYSAQNRYNNGMPPQVHNTYQPNAANYGHPSLNNAPNGIPQQGYPPPQQSHSYPAQGFQPPRQDSGYGSTRGSYSNGSGSNNGLPSIPSNHPQNQRNQQSPPPPQQQHSGSQSQASLSGRVDGADDATVGPEIEETNFFASLPSQFPQKQKPQVLKVQTDTNGTGSEEDESPLTPTQMEILGKLIPDSGTVRKVKRPQPVVAEAYSRRW